MAESLMPSQATQEAVNGKQAASDNSLTTTAKTVIGAINELDGDISMLNTKTSVLQNTAWKTYPGYSGARWYHYENPTAATTYDLPFNYVDVQVIWYGESRAVATAIQWSNTNPGAIWTCGLQDSPWSAWKKLAFDEDADRRWIKASDFVSYALCATNASGYVTVSENGGGYIVSSPPLATKMRINMLNAVYCQFGICSSGASLPNIINTGAGRLSYTSTSVIGKHEIALNGYFQENCFVGGSPGLIIGAVEFYIPN